MAVKLASSGIAEYDDWIIRRSRSVVDNLQRSVLGIHLTPEDAHRALQIIYMSADIHFTRDQATKSIETAKVHDGRKFRLEEDHG